MHLRKLKNEDIPFIYEWMKDPKINCYFRFNAELVTRESINNFIIKAQDTSKDMHLACVNEDDIYLGTISLKNINLKDKTAEYAVSFRAAAQGTGAAIYATKEILRIAFDDLQLEKIYLNVLDDNKRAINFYEKIGFFLEGNARAHIVHGAERKDLHWYGMLRREWLSDDEQSKDA